MGVHHPPFLFGDEPGAVTVRGEVDTEMTIVNVRGLWITPLRQRVETTLRQCFTEHPGGLIVDLTGLDDSAGHSLPTWLDARDHGAGLDPPVPVVLCVPAGTALARRLRRAGVGRLLPVYAKVEEAQADLARLPPAWRCDLWLPPDLRAPSRARQLVSEACVTWQLPDLVFSARMVMSELVTNAVEHTGTAPRVLVSRRVRGLHVAVTDGSRDMPRLLEARPPGRPAGLAEGGRGLQIVHQMVRAWGAKPIDSGKVVWAVLQEEEPGLSQA